MHVVEPTKNHGKYLPIHNTSQLSNITTRKEILDFDC